MPIGDNQTASDRSMTNPAFREDPAEPVPQDRRRERRAVGRTCTLPNRPVLYPYRYVLYTSFVYLYRI